MDIKNRPRIPIPDEDPYSIASSNANGSGSSGSSGYGHGNGHGVVAATREQLLMQMERGQRRGDKPPKLPPREGLLPADIPKVSKNVEHMICELSATVNREADEIANTHVNSGFDDYF